MEVKTDLVLWRGRKYQTVPEPAKPAEPLPGSMLGFAVNGEWRGPAFTDLLEGTYYAAGSLFTAPRPEVDAALRFNFGPSFRFAPPTLDGWPLPQPFFKAADLAPPGVAEAPEGAAAEGAVEPADAAGPSRSGAAAAPAAPAVSA